MSHNVFSPSSKRNNSFFPFGFLSDLIAAEFKLMKHKPQRLI